MAHVCKKSRFQPVRLFCFDSGGLQLFLLLRVRLFCFPLLGYITAHTQQIFIIQRKDAVFVVM